MSHHHTATQEDDRWKGRHALRHLRAQWADGGPDDPPPQLTTAQTTRLLHLTYNALHQWCPWCITSDLQAVVDLAAAIQADPHQRERLRVEGAGGRHKDRRLRRWFAENIAA